MESGKTPLVKTLQLHKPVNTATPAQSCANRLKRKSIGTLKKRNTPEKRSKDSVDLKPPSSVCGRPPIAREGATKTNSSLSLSVRKPVPGALTRSNNALPVVLSSGYGQRSVSVVSRYASPVRQKREDDLCLIKKRLEALEGRTNRRTASETNSTEVEALRAQVSILEKSEWTLRAELSTCRLQTRDAEKQVEKWKSEHGAVVAVSDLLRFELDEARENLRRYEAELRQLHNSVVDLKGNIRVVVRVRPFLPVEPGYGQPPTHFQIPSRNTIIVNGRGKAQPTQHEFQQVFTPSINQSGVFEEVKELLLSSLHGYNVTIMAFGQTGSGKTYTMRGGDGESDEGIIPRAVRFIFDHQKSMKELAWQYFFDVSVCEVYNEEIYDLLDEKKPKLEVKVGSGRVVIPGMTVKNVQGQENVLWWLNLADKLRSVATTKFNPESSRSHLIFQLRVQGQNSISDLAGSERIKESGVVGARLIESEAINTALSSLQNVLRCQLQKTPHIPYRNNKLTMVLRDSLGAGSSKMMMIVCVSPSIDNVEESRRSLEFAAQTKCTTIGVAKKQ